jgi:hypothetical protein
MVRRVGDASCGAGLLQPGCQSGPCFEEEAGQLRGIRLSPQCVFQGLDRVLEIAFVHRVPGGGGLRRDRPPPALSLGLGAAVGLGRFAPLLFGDVTHGAFEPRQRVLHQHMWCRTAEPSDGLRVASGIEVCACRGDCLARAFVERSPLGDRRRLRYEFIECRLHELVRRGLTQALERLLVIAPGERGAGV